MRLHRLQLRPDNPATPALASGASVTLDAYLLHNSQEFQVNRRRPAVIVCPGGGYMGLSDREGEPIALRFAAQGYHAFVLRYAVQTLFPAPMHDLALAVRAVRAHAAEWQVDPDQIAVCGFSAGGHLCAALGVFWDKPFIYEPLGATPEEIRPNALLLCYALIDLLLIVSHPDGLNEAGQPVTNRQRMLNKVLGSYTPAQASLEAYALDRHVSPATPPTFLWHTADDPIVPALNALRFASALDTQRVPFELHVYGNGPHGLALGDAVTEVDGRLLDPHAATWLPLALEWLARRRAQP
ncbi:MAG: alpha/beta hydrolase [Anaerolineales bacterium]|nr:alpha/beta hydrolase [Anaerolineales bacterium]